MGSLLSLIKRRHIEKSCKLFLSRCCLLTNSFLSTILGVFKLFLLLSSSQCLLICIFHVGVVVLVCSCML
ncbi:unnamed protein product [Brassica rapa subsp. trilocularis]